MVQEKKFQGRPEGADLLSKDPILVYEKALLASGDLSDSDNSDLKECAKREVDEAIQFARESQFASPESALDHVFA